jgi:hypothetical protein
VRAGGDRDPQCRSEEFFNHLWTLIGIGQSAYAPWALAGQVGRSSGMSEEIKGIRGRAVRCTVRSVGRKGSCKRACRDPFVRRTSTCRRQARPSDSLQTEPQREVHLPGPYQLTRTAPGVSPCGSRMRGIYRAATLAAWLPRHPLAAAAGGMSG